MSKRYLMGTVKAAADSADDPNGSFEVILSAPTLDRDGEIIDAKAVGQEAAQIVLGKHSGRHAFSDTLAKMGLQIQGDALNAAFARFKDLADRKSEIFDEDIIALVGDESVTAEQEHYRLLSLAQRSETGERPHASVTFAAGESELHAESDGNGPVDASLKAIESKVTSGAELMLYSVNAITTGTDSQGEVTVRLERAGRIVNGQGADTDIIVAFGGMASKNSRVAAAAASMAGVMWVRITRRAPISGRCSASVAKPVQRCCALPTHIFASVTSSGFATASSMTFCRCWPSM